ncbi:hypothetical protein FNU76_05725 [Chitinimonas arctica]|uniref:Uncharacterized protein n=1 Tax=Chitinimonas arctica TaxID=2594795 RepID=A0A516SCK7_9NEIS|nr:hypothetical protein [Chitinimonas arctica]QDQ25889.1 hypothetical protein FNU76_05725 [Chitinimonas arctica]
MRKKWLLLIYSLSLSKARQRVSWLENALGKAQSISDDDSRNEPGTYAELFAGECGEWLTRLYFELMEGMHGLPYSQCSDRIEALAFLQEIVATAMWKYGLPVSVELEAFAREFDRLDVPDERFRLYEKAQEA